MNAVNHPMWWTATEVVGRLAILIDPLRRVPSGNGDQGRLAERFGIHRSTVTAFCSGTASSYMGTIPARGLTVLAHRADDAAPAVNGGALGQAGRGIDVGVGGCVNVLAVDIEADRHQVAAVLDAVMLWPPAPLREPKNSDCSWLRLQPRQTAGECCGL